jgi:hypothetical protein
MEHRSDLLPKGRVRPRRPAALEQTDREDGASEVKDDRHVQAPPRIFQSDIAADGLPEGPGLVHALLSGCCCKSETSSLTAPQSAAQPTLANTPGKHPCNLGRCRRLQNPGRLGRISTGVRGGAAGTRAPAASTLDLAG